MYSTARPYSYSELQASASIQELIDNYFSQIITPPKVCQTFWGEGGGGVGSTPQTPTNCEHLNV